MRLQVGFMAIPGLPPGEVAALARMVEERDFDFLACGEHIFFNVATMNAFVALSAAAAVTERIRLLTATTIAPLYPAGLLAKMAATLDQIAAGRLDLGIGIGGEFPAEFAACGVSTRIRGAKTDELLEESTRLFAGEALVHDGRFARFVGEQLNPLPAQAGDLPIWVGGRRDVAARRAGRYGSYWMPYMVAPDQFETSLSTARAAAIDNGREADAVRGALFAWTATGISGPTMRESAANALERIYGQDFTRMMDRYVPTGTPDDVVTRLGDYIACGADAILISPACGPAELREQLDLFAAEVVPGLRAIHAARGRSSDTDHRHADRYIQVDDRQSIQGRTR